MASTKMQLVKISVVVPAVDIIALDKRAISLRLNRSKYIHLLVRNDLMKPATFKVYPDDPKPKPTPRTVPGVSQDSAGALQIDMPVFLEFCSLTDTPEHRTAANKIAAELMAIKRTGN